jgi:hypothetical protein
MIGRVGLALLVMLPRVAAADEIQPIDFAKHILLVVSRSSMTRPVFEKITKAKNEIVVTVKFPRDQIAARPIHIGTYSAVLIPKTDFPVRLRIVEAQR